WIDREYHGVASPFGGAQCERSGGCCLAHPTGTTADDHTGSGFVDERVDVEPRWTLAHVTSNRARWGAVRGTGGARCGASVSSRSLYAVLARCFRELVHGGHTDSLGHVRQCDRGQRGALELLARVSFDAGA